MIARTRIVELPYQLKPILPSRFAGLNFVKTQNFENK